MSYNTQLTLLDEIDADANGSDATVAFTGDYIVESSADTWGGGTVTLQRKSDAGSSRYADLATFTVNGARRVFLRAGDTVRATLAGATSPSNVSCLLRDAIGA